MRRAFALLLVFLAALTACDPAPACGPDTCGGCCTADGVCDVSQGSQACGALGMSCMSCQPSEVCSTFGSCVPAPQPACSLDLATDPANCGSCGHGCGAAACSAGRCLPAVFASGASPILALTTAGGALYWSHEGVYVPGVGTGSVQRLALEGGTPQVLVDRLLKPMIAVVGTRLYITDDFGYVYGCSVTTACASRSTLLNYSTQSGFFSGLAASSDAVFVLNRGTTDSTGNWSSEIVRCPAAGCSPVDGAGAAQVYSTSAVALISDSASPYWVSLGTGSVVQGTFSGSSPTALTLATPVVGGGALAADDTSLYFVTALTGTFGNKNVVGRVGKSGGPKVDLLKDLPTLGGVAVDDTWVYWSERTTGTIKRMPKAGGAAEVLATGEASPGAMVVTDRDIFWLASGDATIRRLAK